MANAARVTQALVVLVVLSACGEKEAEIIPEDPTDTEQFELHTDVHYTDTASYSLSEDSAAGELQERITKLVFRVTLLESFSGAFVLAEYDRQLRVDYCGQEYDIGDDLYERDGDAEYYELIIENPRLSGCDVEIGFDHGRWRHMRFELPAFIELEPAYELNSQASLSEAFPVAWSSLQRSAQLQFEWSRDAALCGAGQRCEMVFSEAVDTSQTSYTLPASTFGENASEADSLRVSLEQWRYDLNFEESGFNTFSDVELTQYVSIHYSWNS